MGFKRSGARGAQLHGHGAWASNLDYGDDYDGNFTLGAKVTGTDAGGARKITSGPFTYDARLVVSIVTTFPWEK